MNYCTICDMEFISLNDHIDKHHKTETKLVNINEYYKNIQKYEGCVPREEGNEGNKLCPLCKVRVGNLNKHYYSAQHRHNVLKNSVKYKTTLDSMKRHYDSLKNEANIKDIQKKKDDPFWVTARQDLSDKDYKLLREYINGGDIKTRRTKAIRTNTRNSGRRGFSRTA